ncbi:hypothetical protein [Diaphorobacter aerolatus]|uniref:Lipoprotein n=1 Tax=Diaphorobacter aerolatus TaxID=1288495 RepID=A0A7H0GKF7_9BURK|nr:hypothetical protein [Diaphorobacter aerolatus]QNP48773.1 hypothetical protein H9K75_00550 [Diaphorobacter aerolatus]
MKIYSYGFILIFNLLIILSISGCSAIWEGDPRWENIIISKECNSFNGKYYAYDESKHAILTGQIIDRPNTQADGKYSELIKFREDSRAWYSDENEQRRIEAYKKYIVYLEKKGSILNAYLFNHDEQPDLLLRIKLDHTNVGCDRHGNLIMRSVRLRQGGEFTIGSAYATETSLSIRPDESLQVIKLERIWFGTMEKVPDKSKKDIYLFNPVK